ERQTGLGTPRRRSSTVFNRAYFRHLKDARGLRLRRSKQRAGRKAWTYPLDDNRLRVLNEPRIEDGLQFVASPSKRIAVPNQVQVQVNRRCSKLPCKPRGERRFSDPVSAIDSDHPFLSDLKVTKLGRCSVPVTAAPGRLLNQTQVGIFRCVDRFLDESQFLGLFDTFLNDLKIRLAVEIAVEVLFISSHSSNTAGGRFRKRATISTASLWLCVHALAARKAFAPQDLAALLITLDLVSHSAGRLLFSSGGQLSAVTQGLDVARDICHRSRVGVSPAIDLTRPRAS